MRQLIIWIREKHIHKWVSVDRGPKSSENFGFVKRPDRVLFVGEFCEDKTLFRQHFSHFATSNTGAEISSCLNVNSSETTSPATQVI